MVSLSPPNNLLAVNVQLNEKVELSEGSLANCEKRRNVFLCKRGLSSRNILSTCLGALYMGVSRAIIRYCPFEPVSDLEETASPVGEKEVMIYAPPNKLTSLYISCKGKDMQQQAVRGFIKLILPDGCVATTPHFNFMAHDSRELGVGFVSRPLIDFVEKVVLPELKDKFPERALPPEAHDDEEKEKEKGDYYIGNKAFILIIILVTLSIFSAILACSAILGGDTACTAAYTCARWFSHSRIRGQGSEDQGNAAEEGSAEDRAGQAIPRRRAASYSPETRNAITQPWLDRLRLPLFGENLTQDEDEMHELSVLHDQDQQVEDEEGVSPLRPPHSA